MPYETTSTRWRDAASGYCGSVVIKTPYLPSGQRPERSTRGFDKLPPKYGISAQPPAQARLYLPSNADRGGGGQPQPRSFHPMPGTPAPSTPSGPPSPPIACRSRIYPPGSRHLTTIAFLAWNRRDYVVESLQGHLEHSSPHVLYVCDNGSTDGTTDYIRGLTAPPYIELHKLYFKKNYGPYRVWNLVFRRSQTELTGSIMSDVRPETDWVGVYQQAAENFPDLIAFCMCSRDWPSYPMRSLNGINARVGPHFAFGNAAMVLRTWVINKIERVYDGSLMRFNSPICTLGHFLANMHNEGPTAVIENLQERNPLRPGNMSMLTEVLPRSGDAFYRRLGIMNRLLFIGRPSYYMRALAGTEPLEWEEDGEQRILPLDKEMEVERNRLLVETDEICGPLINFGSWSYNEFNPSWAREFPDLWPELEPLTRFMSF